jgi:hypothetical protein
MDLMSVNDGSEFCFALHGDGNGLIVILYAVVVAILKVHALILLGIEDIVVFPSIQDNFVFNDNSDLLVLISVDVVTMLEVLVPILLGGEVDEIVAFELVLWGCSLTEMLKFLVRCPEVFC